MTSSGTTAFKIGIFCLLFFAAVTVLLRYQQRESIKMESIFREFPDVDELDFHFMAVNFALANQFPVIGYLRDTNAYMISYKHGLSAGVDSLYLNMFKIAGPVHTFARPPLCSLLVGMLYKIFGVHLYVLIWFNILLVAAMAGTLPYVGYRIWNLPGFFSGIIASVLFLCTLDFSYVSMDLEILAAFLFLIIFYVLVLIDIKYSIKLMLLLGILISLEFLNKPVILFIPALFLLYYYFNSGKPKLLPYLKQISPGLIGIALVMLPWTLYINHEKSISVKERADWSVKTLASMDAPLTYSSPQEVGSSVANIEHAMRNFVKFIYVCHTQQEGGSFMMTNQFRGGLSLMFLNNEFCVNNVGDMGSFGWLWKMIPSSYYNTHHLSSSNIMKVFYFYIENPEYMYKIPATRLIFSVEYPLVFWLAFALWSLSVISMRMQKLKNNLLSRFGPIVIVLIAVAYCVLAFYPIISDPLMRFTIYAPIYILALLLWRKGDNRRLSAYPILWLGIFLFILLVYGDQRFTKAAFAVNCLAIAYYAYTLMISALKKQENNFSLEN